MMARIFTRHGPAAVLIGVILILAGAVRLVDLGSRPMHADEANQAVKLGALLESGDYRFDPHDHHGPTLYYFALIPAWLRGQTTLARLTETTVRLTPAVFGMLGVLLIAGVAAPLGARTAVMAAALLAVAPASAYYSRYFIQETLLVTFCLAAWVCAKRTAETRSIGWAVGAGISLGLMQATKASAPVFVLAAVVAWLCVRERRWTNATAANQKAPLPVVPIPRAVATGNPKTASGAGLGAILGWAAAGFAVTFVCFYSSFFTHFQGLRDAFTTYGAMGARAVGLGGAHDKPWWYYADLFWRHRRGGYVWDQTLFLSLAVGGGILSLFLQDRLARGVAVYLAVLAVMLSATPYKTPWIVVHFVPPMAILAAWLLARVGEWRCGRFPAALVFLAVFGILTWQMRLTVFRFPAAERNPLAYVHSGPDVLKVAGLAERAPPGPIKVISEEYWPLPWYLRRHTNVGYWTTVPDDCDASLIFVSATLANEVRSRLQGHYKTGYLGLRPGFVMLTFLAEP